MAVFSAAALIAVVAIVASLSGSGSGGSGSGGGGVRAASEVRRLLEGIPQDGFALGDPRAPLALVEFVDLQCPFCAELARDALPSLIDREVRARRLRLELRVLAFIGPDSQRTARFAAAAARQDRAWHFVELFFRNQGRENSGYATDEFLRRLGNAIPGFDLRRALAFARTAASEDDLERARAEAQRLGVSATPTLFLVARGGPPRRLDLRELTAEALREAIQRAGGR